MILDLITYTIRGMLKWCYRWRAYAPIQFAFFDGLRISSEDQNIDRDIEEKIKVNAYYMDEKTFGKHIRIDIIIK